jgi:hypothetical protein
MIRPLCAVLLPLFLVAPAAAASAQEVLARKVTLDVNAASPASVFKAVASASGASFTVTVDPAVTEPVDISVRNVSVKTALNAICESIGCQWTLSGNLLVVKPLTSFAVGVVQHDVRIASVHEDKASARAQVVLSALKQKLPAGMKFENAPLGEINKRLSEVLNLNVQLGCKDPAVQTLTMDFSNLTLQAALQAIGQQEVRPEAAWRVTIGPLPGDTRTPSVAIMVGPKVVKKSVTKRQ